MPQVLAIPHVLHVSQVLYPKWERVLALSVQQASTASVQGYVMNVIQANIVRLVQFHVSHVRQESHRAKVPFHARHVLQGSTKAQKDRTLA